MRDEAALEVKGSGDSYDFWARILDARLRRWLGVGPAGSLRPSASPFSYCWSNPIIQTDPNGEYPLVV
jgi:hypothetical protein